MLVQICVLVPIQHNLVVMIANIPNAMALFVLLMVLCSHVQIVVQLGNGVQ